jgi:hypothetical protein
VQGEGERQGGQVEGEVSGGLRAIAQRLTHTKF